MKKRILLVSMAFMGLVQLASALKPIDVSATYLANYTQPFTGTGTYLDGGIRFQQLASPWVTEGIVGTMGTKGCTIWHVDGQKGGALTLTSSWDGFAASAANMKVYQTVNLPAGKYRLTTSIPKDKGAANGTYIVVDDAAGLPNESDLATNALAYSTASDSLIVHFSLDAQTQVSLGAVAGSAFGEWNCMTLGSWELSKYEEGTDYTYLNAVLATAKGLNSTDYPTGTTVGKYSQAKWDALQTAIANTEALVATGDASTQSAVDNQRAALRLAIDELIASLIPVFYYSDDNNTYWYQLNTPHATKKYLTIGAFGGFANAIVPTTTGNSAQDGQLFKFVKAPTTGFYIYSKAAPGKACGWSGNVVAFDATLNPVSWLYTASSKPDYYLIRRTSDNAAVATYPSNLGFWTDPADPNCQFTFVLATTQVVTSVDADVLETAGVHVGNGMIVSEDPMTKLSICNTLGQKVDANSKLSKGIYLVKTEGRKNVVKVLVK